MADGRISITIEADDKFSTVLNRINKQLKRTGKESKDAARGMAKLGFSVIALNQAMELFQRFGRPIIALGKQLLEVTDKFRRMEIALTSLTGSATFARESFKRLVEITRATPFTLDSMTESFVRLKSTGVKNTERVLKGIVNAVSAFGGTEQDIKLVALAFQQMAGKGVVSMEELRRQLGERVPTAMRILARELNLTLPQLFAKVEKGALDSFEAIEALTRGFEKDFSGAAERMLNTWSGATAKLTTSWQLFLSEIGKKGVLDEAITSVRSMTSALDVLATNIDKVISVFKVWFTLLLIPVTAPAVAVETLKDIWNGMIATMTIAGRKQKILNDMMEREKVILDGRLIAWKEINERIEENKKRQERATIAGLKAAGVYKLGASGLKAWNKQLRFNDPLVAAGTFEIEEQTKALEKLEEKITEARNATKGLTDVVEFNRLQVLMSTDAYGRASEHIESLTDIVEFNRLQVLMSTDAYRSETDAVLDAVNAIKSMVDVEFELGKILKENEDKIKTQGQLFREFFKGQAEKIGGQVLGLSGAIQGFQAGGVWGAVIGFFTEILLASPKMQAAIGKLNSTIARVFEPIIEDLIPGVEAVGETMEEVNVLLKELMPLIKLLNKGALLGIKGFNAGLRFINSIWKVLKRILVGLWSVLKSLWEVIKKLIDAFKKVGKTTQKVTDPLGISEKLALPFHEGGVIQRQDLLRGPGMRPNEGLILAKAGERVQTEEQQQHGSEFHFHVNAIDPRGSSQEIRLVVQELQAQGLL